MKFKTLKRDTGKMQKRSERCWTGIAILKAPFVVVSMPYTGSTTSIYLGPLNGRPLGYRLCFGVRSDRASEAIAFEGEYVSTEHSRT